MMKQNIVILDEKHQEKIKVKNAIVMAPMEYILGDPDTKYQNVYNFSSDLSYQGIGYYVSLLAQARLHKVYPEALIIQDLKDKKIQSLYSDDIHELAQKKLKDLKGDNFELSVYLGKNLAGKHDKLAWALYRVIRAPIFRVFFEKKDVWRVRRVKILDISELSETHLEFLNARLDEYFSQGLRVYPPKDDFKFDLAILVDSNEKSPPSDARAIKKFIKAGKKVGLNCEVVEHSKKPNIFEYDALFIRETTNVSHHTYRLARRAEKEGLAVMDDPVSILRCTNKVFLEQLMQRLNIQRPKSYIFSEKKFLSEMDELALPCVLKRPDSAFSQGVYKAKSKEELERFGRKVFASSELLLVQEFLPTDYDWRIGILNNEVIYACKYHMAKDHWQIVNNREGEVAQEGGFECVEIEQVNKKVLAVALKLCRYIGNGLYGVDLKEKDGEVYVIEVNDNPSIEAGVEDGILGERLYEIIMERFLEMCMDKRKTYEKNI